MGVTYLKVAYARERSAADAGNGDLSAVIEDELAGS